MSRSQKPRTPRYWPRMKVRGARRKRLRTMYVFQRIGDAGVMTGVSLMAFGNALINAQAAIESVYAREQVLKPHIEPYNLADLGTSIMKEDHAEH